MNRAASVLLIAIAIALVAAAVLEPRLVTGQDKQPEIVLVVQERGPIGPATAAFLVDAIEQAAMRQAQLLVIEMDTPGGLDSATRDIIQAILTSPVPVATFVTPAGSRAASAGTYILYASHVAAMSEATNLGAATPVSITGGPAGGAPAPGGSDEDDANAAPADPGSRKAINDSVAYIRGLAEKRDRNAEWAEAAVREAVSITATRALELNVIDLVADDLPDLLGQIDGWTVTVADGERSLETAGATIERLERGWQTKFLETITSPTVAYILLLVGFYGLLLEGYSPGAIVPGVVGAIALLLALYALQMLPVNYAGLGLIVLGVILLVAEAVAPSFGALGLGGIVALVIGSIMLIDTDAPGFEVSRPLIGAIAATAAVGIFAIATVAVKARQRPVVAGREELIGAAGTALGAFDETGAVMVHGERWNAVAEVPVADGQAIEVIGLDGLTLRVRPAPD